MNREPIYCRYKINSRAFIGWFGVFLLMLGVAVCSSAARAQSSGELEVHVGEGRMIQLGEDAANVMVANSGIADVQTVTNRVFYLYGRRPGATTLTRMPFGASCWARALEIVLIAALVVA